METRFGTNDSGSEHFAGLIDEVRFYSRPLTASEIQIANGPTLPSISEDAASSTAVTVNTLLADAGESDPDAGALKGLAVVGTSGPGTWKYSLNGRAWLGVGPVSETSTLPLPAAAMLRFKPALHQFGTADITYRAWDQTAGTSGSLFNAAASPSSISAVEATATLNVNHVNHAPIWSGSAAALSPVLPNTTNPPGDTVAAVFGSYFSDIDPNTTVGVAVTALTGTADGSWQYATDGGTTWNDIGAVATGAAFVVIRQRPDPLRAPCRLCGPPVEER